MELLKHILLLIMMKGHDLLLMMTQESEIYYNVFVLMIEWKTHKSCNKPHKSQGE